MEPSQKPKNHGIIKFIGAVIVLGLAALGFSKLENKDVVVSNVASGDQSGTTPTGTTSTTTETTSASTYKNGTYTSTGSYNSPGGTEQVGISLTLNNDVVTSATFTPEAGDPTSKRYQSDFAAGFKALVVGKNIDSLNLTVVNGASLTPKGFNNAVTKIKTEAKA
jgi:uncharacterized protein with FMN-binding domain